MTGVIGEFVRCFLVLFLLATKHTAAAQRQAATNRICAQRGGWIFSSFNGGADEPKMCVPRLYINIINICVYIYTYRYIIAYVYAV